MRVLLFALALLVAGPPALAHHMAPMPAAYKGQADKPGAPLFEGLGAHTHTISSHNPLAQRYFNQGVNLLFGFNHAEAIRSFHAGAEADPHCAMCWWGVAFALGPNINMEMPEDAVLPAWQALQRAVSLEGYASAEERAWIEALRTRYTANAKADRKPLDAAFAAAMAKVWKAYPDDLDAGTFYVEAMMDTQPWQYWDLDGVTPRGHAEEIVGILEGIIKREPNHPGALHLYIHAVEATTTPERAEAPADRLSTLMPGAGHIVHMPSHIYYRVGRYEDAARVNAVAATVDEGYIASCRAQGFYPVGYYGHNIHFLWTSSEMEGRYQTAIDASRRLVKAIAPDNNTADAPEVYMFTPVVTLLRFGHWSEILAEPAPDPKQRLWRGVWLYARGFAHANTGALAAARADREALAAILTGDLSDYAKGNLPAKQMVSVSLALLDGEIARVTGHLDDAVARFSIAAQTEKQIPYSEPPYWQQPVSHLLGAALIQAGRPDAAEAVYRESLKSYRRDGWALKGLELALAAQGKDTSETHKAFADAWKLADTRLESSRF
jgi:tetratricopeptide (TPR) repeat protein